jgi:hypothetical protein
MVDICQEFFAGISIGLQELFRNFKNFNWIEKKKIIRVTSPKNSSVWRIFSDFWNLEIFVEFYFMKELERCGDKALSKF